MIYVIEPNLSKEKAYQTALAAIAQLKLLHASVRMSMVYQEEFKDSGVIFCGPTKLYEHADFIIAIGGDGTILRSAGSILEYAEKTHTKPAKIVGINTGTLGFLATFEANELDMLNLLESGDYSISERMLLETSVTDSDGKTLVCRALNDIYASRINGRICDFAVSVDGHQICVYRADGIIFSTPTGSSAYALSAGGPVMEPDLSVIEMNLICPHSLFARPMLFSPQRHISVTCHGVEDEDGLRVNVDGTEAVILHNKQSFTVHVPALSMPFVNLKGHAFYDALNGKLMRPLKR
ncbi:MAG: NAD(+)/NADH kinase [Oscillospiraceae bacterium]|nr:NAD(+)/NADH kinase [Oscillospiraceae bacterium]